MATGSLLNTSFELLKHGMAGGMHCDSKTVDGSDSVSQTNTVLHYSLYSAHLFRQYFCQTIIGKECADGRHMHIHIAIPVLVSCHYPIRLQFSEFDISTTNTAKQNTCFYTEINPVLDFAFNNQDKYDFTMTPSLQ